MNIGRRSFIGLLGAVLATPMLPQIPGVAETATLEEAYTTVEPVAFSAITDSLKRCYSADYFRAFQNDFTPALSELSAADLPSGPGEWHFPLHLTAPA